MIKLKLISVTLLLAFLSGCFCAEIASVIISQNQDWAEAYSLFNFDDVNDRFVFKSAASCFGFLLPVACCWALARRRVEQTGIIDDILIP
jgi:hypothetical protein